MQGKSGENWVTAGNFVENLKRILNDSEEMEESDFAAEELIARREGVN